MPTTQGLNLSRRQLLAAGGAAVGALAIGAAAPAGKAAAASGGQSTTVRYRSRPDLEAPRITVTGPTGQPAAGYVAVTPAGPMLVDNSGEPVWIQSVAHASANLRVQQFQGQPVLTWWQGTLKPVGGGIVSQSGKYVVLDGNYQPIMTVRARKGLVADLHDFLIDEHGVAYFTVYHRTTADLRSLGGPKKGPVLDATIQGVDLETGKLVFDWSSLEHIGFDESYSPYKKGTLYDPYHLNSVSTTPDGKLMFSARNTWTLYKIEPSTGEILWRLGGKKSDFALGKDVRFAWQHHATAHTGNVITVFDDEAGPPEAKQSRGLVLSFDDTAMTVTMTNQYFHPHKSILTGSQGSVQFLENGDVFVGWGAKPYYTEYQSDGTPVLDGKFATGHSYRAFRFPWTGTPTTRPAVAAARKNGRTTVYASWNGSTATASWVALGGPKPGLLEPVGAAPRRGFETAIPARGATAYVAARALDSNGNILAVSPPVKV